MKEMNNAHESKQTQKDESMSGQSKDQDALPATVRPNYPNWPTSLPGPFRKQPPKGMKSMNALRSEQFAEINYDQTVGEPEKADPHRYHPEQAMEGRASFDQATKDV